MINTTNSVNELQNSSYINNLSKNQKTSEVNFKDTVSEVDRVNAVKERIEKEIPGVYLNVVDYKKINGFQSNSYPIDKVFQKDLTLQDLNHFPRLKNSALNSQETLSSNSRCLWKKATLIHPDTLDKMSKDPAYADKIISQIKKWTDRVGTCADPAYPNAMTTSMIVSVDENGNVERQWSTGGSASIVESKTGVRGEKDKRRIEKERLEKYLEKLWYERKLTQKAIRNLQISRKDSLNMILKSNLLKSNPYDLS